MIKTDFLKTIAQFNSSNPTVLIIYVIAVIICFLFFKKLFEFYRDEINIRNLMDGLENTLRRNGYTEALMLCDTTPGPVARLFYAAIRAKKTGSVGISRALDEAAMEEIPRLERHIPLIGTLASSLPAIGIFIALIGLLNTMDGGSGNFSTTTPKSIFYATLTVALALGVAIPAHWAHNFLVMKTNNVIRRMEAAADEIENYLRENQDEHEKH